MAGSFWFVADLHLGHAKVARLRGFDTVAEHDEHVLGSLSRIPASDMLFILGDLSSSREAEQAYALEQVSGLRCRKRLIPGNHDPVSPVHRGGWKHQKQYLEVFEAVEPFARIRVNGTQVLLSHFPYASIGDGVEREGPARYLEYRLPDTGLPLVHGHTHQKRAHEFVDGVVFWNQFCVSWDVRQGPATYDEIDAWVTGVKPLLPTRTGTSE